MTTAKLCCPSCGQFESRVIDVRPTKSCESVWRRRCCTHCGEKFTTKEQVVPTTRPTEKIQTYNI
jgi:transcriptional regulator NrdR family protein